MDHAYVNVPRLLNRRRVGRGFRKEVRSERLLKLLGHCVSLPHTQNEKHRFYFKIALL